MCHCPYCFNEVSLIQDAHWGLICGECRQEMNRMERETDWDTWEADKRQRIAETNEY